MWNQLSQGGALKWIGLSAIVLMVYFYIMGTSTSIDWHVTTHAEATTFEAYGYDQGLFHFSFPADFYQLAESFSAGPILRNIPLESVLLIIIWAGLLLLLAYSTTMPLLWFAGFAGGYMFIIKALNLSDINFLGLPTGGMWAELVVIVLIVGSSFVFHSFLPQVKIVWRWLALAVLSAALVYFGTSDYVGLVDQVTVGLHFSLIVVMLLFLMVIAEENVFAILYLVTKSKDSSHNEKHFSVFSVLYLVLIGLAYAKKAGLIALQLPFFDPYMLLCISTLVAFWSLKHKEVLYDNIIYPHVAIRMFFAAVITVFAFLALSFARGNDPVYEGFHYFIIYAHLGFGAFFFFYVIINFIDPLSRGMAVYKAVYKGISLPYASARIAGIVAVLAFFFFSDKQAFKLFRAGHYNYLGAQAETQKNPGLAFEYWQEGGIYGYNNHYSNYQMAYRQLQKGEIEEANYYFDRATRRYPSPQSFVNQSSTSSKLNDVTGAEVALKEGLEYFPNEPAILNNLGLIYLDLGDDDKAAAQFEKANETGKWAQANHVNLWKMGKGANPVKDFEEGNIAVKTNVIGAELQAEEPFEGFPAFDSTWLVQTYPLHRQAFLINEAFAHPSEEVSKVLAHEMTKPMQEPFYEKSAHALALSNMKLGKINDALRSLDVLQLQSSGNQRAKYLNQIGLIYLHEYALDQARDSFEQAVQLGNQDAAVNLVATYLELGENAEALDALSLLTQQNADYLPLLEQLKSFLNTMSDGSYAQHYYYAFDQNGIDKVKEWLFGAEPFYAEQLWRKLTYMKEVSELKQLYTHFEPKLSESVKKEYQQLLALENGKIDGFLSNGVSDSTEIVNELVDLAKANSFNENKVLSLMNVLAEKDALAAYNVLVEAIEFNPSSVRLLQAYILSAVENHLKQYAEEKLLLLSTMMENDAYEDFLDVYDEAVNASEELVW